MASGSFGGESFKNISYWNKLGFGFAANETKLKRSKTAPVIQPAPRPPATAPTAPSRSLPRNQGRNFYPALSARPGPKAVGGGVPDLDTRVPAPKPRGLPSALSTRPPSAPAVPAPTSGLGGTRRPGLAPTAPIRKHSGLYEGPSFRNPTPALRVQSVGTARPNEAAKLKNQEASLNVESDDEDEGFEVLYTPKRKSRISNASARTNPVTGLGNQGTRLRIETLPDDGPAFLYPILPHSLPEKTRKIMHKKSKSESYINVSKSYPSQPSLFSGSSSEFFEHKEPAKEKTWKWYLENYQTCEKRQKRLFRKKLEREPPPEEMRGKFWMELLNSSHLLKTSKGYFEAVLKKQPPARVIDLIRKDLERTRIDELCDKNCPGSEKFSIQKLNRVLCAYAVHDAEVAYCQGMNYIVALLLLWMTEEEAFYTMVALLEHGSVFQLRDLYLDSLPLLKERYFEMEQLLSQFCPQVHAKFKQLHVHPAMYSSRWFLTLFAYDLPPDKIARIWDLLFLLGPKFSFQIGIALMKTWERNILRLPFDKLIPFLQAMETVDIDKLLQLALVQPLSKKHMRMLSTSYETKAMLTLAKVQSKPKKKRKPARSVVQSSAEFW